jgi:hypothetical protein
VGALPKYQCKAGHQASVIFSQRTIASLRKKNNFTAVYTGLIKLVALSFSFTILKEVSDEDWISQFAG